VCTLGSAAAAAALKDATTAADRAKIAQLEEEAKKTLELYKKREEAGAAVLIRSAPAFNWHFLVLRAARVLLLRSSGAYGRMCSCCSVAQPCWWRLV
jgi:hypothetical protein